jgi:alpha-beta hydrolase superfamily lysophospholipase
MERDPVELQIDVTDAAGLAERLTLAASVFLPEARDSSPAILVFCIPGATRTRAVWNMTVPGRGGYSFAEFASDRGFVVCTFDVLATGESSRPSDPGFSTDLVARTSAALVEDVTARLRDGALEGEREPWQPALIAAIGHSMGGFFAIRQQALFSSYDALAVLGYSTLFPMLLYGRGDQSLFFGLTDEDQAIALGRASGIDPYATNPADHDRARRMNYLDDVPADVIAAHEAVKTNAPGYSAAATLIPGIVARDAGAIHVPVFLGFAERDTSRDPWMEVASYRGSRDLTVHVLAGSAHATSCSATRQEQWDRILAWLLSVTPG